MFDRKRGVDDREGMRRGQGPGRAARRPTLEALEGRQLLVATLNVAPTLTVPATVGFQLPLDGGTGAPQTYTVTSSNPAVQATVAQGKFLTVGVSHDSSGPGDPAFTGSLTFQLFDDLTPLTASKIEQLVNEGFYTAPTAPSTSNGQTIPNTPLPSKNFHRVVPGFVVQGGSQTGTGAGPLNQAGYPFPDEYNPTLVYDGTAQLAMANAGNDTNDSQFFITLSSPRNLDFNKTIFGQLVAGQDTLAKMAAVKTVPGSNGGESSQPVNPILFTSATLSDANPDGVIHINTTQSKPGDTSTLTITAADPSTGTTTTRNVQVTVTPNVDSKGNAVNEQPFLLPVANQVVGQINGTTPQNAVFKLNAYDSEPTDTLTYIVGGVPAAGTPLSLPLPAVQGGKATVDSNGVVTVTPNAGFTGVINLTVGVRDNVDHSGTGNLETITNYDTQKISVTVVNGQPVNLAPIALPGAQAVTTETPTTVQLNGQTANPQSTTQTLNYTIVTPPTHGTISNFDATKGTFTYTPTPGFQGNDFVNYSVTDVGAPGPSLTSNVATESLTVGGGSTGAVRQIGRVLVVTPLPRTDGGANTILVTQSGGNVQVTVNGILDQAQPAQSALDRIVVYGSKASDNIAVAQDVTVPTTLDGGHGGNNTVLAGGGASLMHGWFGRTTLQGGPQDDTLIGQAGRVRFRKSVGNDVYYAGQVLPRTSLHGINFPGQRIHAAARKHKGRPPKGTFFRFVNDRLVPTTPPKFPVTPRRIVIPSPSAQGNSSSSSGQVAPPPSSSGNP